MAIVTSHQSKLNVLPSIVEDLLVLMFSLQDAIDKEINDIKEFFTDGEGKDCNLTSLYAQVNPTRYL
jgi:hypothetical protein